MSTGLILVSGYAHKIRRTMFAQLKDMVKSGEVSNKEVAYKTGILNKILFEVLVGKLQLDKHDVVRIRIDYEVENGEIKWDYDTIQIEVWKRSDDLAEKAVNEFKRLLEQEQFMREAGYTLSKIGTTPLGEDVYAIEREGERIGVIKVMPLNDNLIVAGVILEPARKIRTVIPTPENMETALPTILSRGTEIPEEEAKKILEEILAGVKV